VPDEEAGALGEVVARRRQLVDMLTAEQTRRRLLGDCGLQRDFDTHIAWLKDAPGASTLTSES
jgi:transposase